MSTEEGLRLGLRAAATLLECTAEDFEEMAKKKEEHLPPRRTPYIDHLREKMLVDIGHLQDKAKLLRGQAEEVRALKVTRGR